MQIEVSVGNYIQKQWVPQVAWVPHSPKMKLKRIRSFDRLTITYSHVFLASTSLMSCFGAVTENIYEVNFSRRLIEV